MAFCGLFDVVLAAPACGWGLGWFWFVEHWLSMLVVLVFVGTALCGCGRRVLVWLVCVARCWVLRGRSLCGVSRGHAWCCCCVWWCGCVWCLRILQWTRASDRLPLCGVCCCGVCFWFVVLFCFFERSVDALASGADEGRGGLR